MTRKKQIDQAVNSTYPSSHDSVSRVAFRKGIRWAEDNPNHEAFNIRLKLEKEEWLDKACEWLDEHIWDYIETQGLSDFEILKEIKVSQMIEDFEKYMEDK